MPCTSHSVNVQGDVELTEQDNVTLSVLLFFCCREKTYMIVGVFTVKNTSTSTISTDSREIQKAGLSKDRKILQTTSKDLKSLQTNSNLLVDDIATKGTKKVHSYFQ